MVENISGKNTCYTPEISMHVFRAEAKVFKPFDVIKSKLGSSPGSIFEIKVAVAAEDDLHWGGTKSLKASRIGVHSADLRP